MKKNTKSNSKNRKKNLNITSVDINGKPIDEKKVKLPDDLARKCLEIASREGTRVDK